MPRVPDQLLLSPALPFAGRAAELSALEQLTPGAGGGPLRVALVGGAPGVGKSRLAREYAGRAAAAGALVLHGSCDPVVRPPYRPFVECLDRLVRELEPAALRACLGPGAGELTRLLPDLPALAGELPAPVRAGPDTERHRLHTAVVDLLAGAARRTPLLVVVEDLQWADAPSLLLLRRLARARVSAPALVVATFRDTEADVPRALADVLADLRRSEDVVRIRLGRLGDDAIEALVAAAAGEPGGAAEVARAVGELTGGNAFLVTELVRALVASGAVERDDGRVRLVRPPEALAAPQGVRELVGQRLAGRSAATVEVLEVAAVLGSPFEVRVLERAGAQDGAAVLAALGEAARSGIVEAVPPLELAYRFVHELVRRAILDRLTPERAARCHLLAGRALEAVHGDEPARVLPHLAHHFAAAGALADTRRAVDYNLRAAAAARGSVAFDAAAEHLRVALELGIDEPGTRLAARLRLAEAERLAGHWTEARAAYEAAAALARERGDAGSLARAATGYDEACWQPGIPDRRAIDLLEEAAVALGPGDSTLHVRVLAGLARSLAVHGDPAGSAAAGTRAAAMARRIGDRRGLAKVLAGVSKWPPGTHSRAEVAELLRMGAELIHDEDDVETRTEAMAWRTAAMIGLGDLGPARAELGRLQALAARTGQPINLHVAEQYAATIALCEGHLDDAEAAAERSYAWGRLMTGQDPAATHGVQMFSLRREQGRLGEVAPVIRSLAAGDRAGSVWRAGLIALLAELGMHEQAGRELERIAAEGLDALRPALWLPSLTYLADACAAVGDARAAALLYPELAGFAGTVVTVGHGVACYGSADRYLGMLAATSGERELAAGHFEAALAAERAGGARTWVAHSAYEYARMLPAGGVEAAELLDEAARLAQAIGMAGLLARVRRLGPAPALPDGLSPREVQILGLLARGRSNRDIGGDLVISEHTAANHVKSILRKTGCANRAEAASYAHRHGLVEA